MLRVTMDERSIEWLRLLPSTAQFAGTTLPPRLRSLLSDRFGPSPTAYVGWQLTASDLPAPDGFEAIALLRPRGIDAQLLARMGFRHTLQFSVLPSLADPRVFAPLDNSRVAARALDFITLYRPLARLARRATFAAARLGQLGRLGDRVVLARRCDSELERWLAGATGRQRVYLAVSPGGISHKRKVTIQVMDADGTVIAYAKVAGSPRAVEATERESAWLRALADHHQLDGSVPRLIDQRSIGETFVTLLSPGPGALAPRTFGPAHWTFLSNLTTATQRSLPFEQSTMWANLRGNLEVLGPRLPLAWRTRLAATVERVGALLGGQVLPLSLAHRDFQPGNMRQFPDGRLFVYDWEGAQPESTPLYDLFNFDFLHSMRLNQLRLGIGAYLAATGRRWRPDLDQRLVPALFGAYLADHTQRRLTNSDLARDPRGTAIMGTIADLLDHQAEWLGRPV